MSNDVNDVTPSRGEASTLYVAVEVSDKAWVVGIGDPKDPGRVSMHTLTPDSSSWPTSPPRARRPASPESRRRRRGKTACGESGCESSAFPPSVSSGPVANQGLTNEGS